jgi:uncharacterized membrane protein
MNTFIRSKAREDLKGNWGIAILTMIVFVILTFIIQQVPAWFTAQPTIIEIIQNPALATAETGSSLGSSFISMVLSIFILSALQVGYISVHIMIGKYENPTLGTLFSGFSSKYKLIVITTVLTALLSVAYSLPVIIAAVIAGFFLGMGSFFLGFVFSLVMLGALIWSIIKVIPLSMIPYELANDDSRNDSPVELIKGILLVMDGSKGDLFMLGLSFIPWMILVGITFGLAGFYVFPYMQQSFANFYEDHC